MRGSDTNGRADSDGAWAVRPRAGSAENRQGPGLEGVGYIDGAGVLIDGKAEWL